MAADYAGIVEVVEVGRRQCTYFLTKGYQLLHIAQTTRDRERPNGQLYIQRHITYVMGRTAFVAHVDFPNPRELEG